MPFALRAGETNDWLKVQAIDMSGESVAAVLKQPVVRVRSVGIEVILSLRTHGAKTAIGSG